MIGFESRRRLRQCLLGGTISLLVWAIPAGAEILVPFTPGNLLEPSVVPTWTGPDANGEYTYSYSITLDGSDPAKPQKAAKFALALRGDVTPITTPAGWMFGQYRTESLVFWGCIEPEALEAGEYGIPLCSQAIAPDSAPVVFSLRSINPPGGVSFMIQGDKKSPVATSEDDDLGPMVDSDIRVDSVRGDTIGPVGPDPAQTCSGPNTDNLVCDDGYFCNGPDRCLNGSCSQHDGNPCIGKDDGDADCAEDCDENNNNCSRNDEVGSPCPEDGNPCTVDECDLGECVHTPGNAGEVCGASQGDCQVERTCTGTSIGCPSFSNAPAGTACSDDGNPCTIDQCDAEGSCTHTAGNTGAICRASQGACDAPETCTGTSASCPFDQLAAVGTVCRGSSGICDTQETCTGSSASCPANVFGSSTVTCRAAAGVCDVAETCTGTSGSCPVDGLLPSTSSCRASAGDCDAPETCTGTSASCPPDQFTSVGTVCRESSGICDTEETCTGSSASCPADAFASSTVTCRASAGVCDVAETCTGTSSTCPADGMLPSTSSCRASTGACDVQERCTGTSASCPVDLLASAGAVCRASTSICDPQETCTGSSTSCPANVFASSAVTCRSAAGVCDVAEKCTGSSSTCPADGMLSSTNTCRGSAGVCDVVERCSGTSPTCPSDQFAGSGLPCRASQGECDEPETCSGSAATCPDNVGTICVPDCPPSPLDVPCDEFEKGELTLRTEAPEKKRLHFRGFDAPEIAVSELGNPQVVDDTTRYLFCAYNSGSLISKIAVDPQGGCQKTVSSTGQCWSPDPEHFGRLWYRDRSRDPQNGLSTVVFNAKRRLKVSMKGRGRDLQIIPTDLDSLANSHSVEFQVIRTNGTQFAKCWHVDLPVPDKSTATRFTAKSN